MKKEELVIVLEKHRLWLINDPSGERADLRGANLRGADLGGADLGRANLRGADLGGADLGRANLRGANLRGANLGRANLGRADLRGADLGRADLRGADLRGADLRGADLYGADLYGADLYGADHNEHTAFFALQCPEEGAYIAYKAADGKIVKLEISADALRSSATSRKCRASKAKVLSITTVDGEDAGSSVASDHDHTFIYTVGETVEVPDFDTDRWKECAPGIHHFITREEAVMWARR